MKWFKKNKKKLIHEAGNIYVVDAGTYGGDYLVLIDTDYSNGLFKFLALPDLSKRDILFETFERGVSFKVVNFIEKLPQNIFETCKQQYETINNAV